MDENYDGYYDDVPPIDAGWDSGGIDEALVKRVVLLVLGAICVIALAIVLMTLLQFRSRVRVIGTKPPELGVGTAVDVYITDTTHLYDWRGMHQIQSYLALEANVSGAT